MKSTKPKVAAVNQDIFQNVAKISPIALIHHLQIKDGTAYNNWMRKSKDLLESMAGNRFFNLSVDPVPREGMYVDEIVIDEYPSAEAALKSATATQAELMDSCKNVTILAIQPEAPLKFRIVRIAAWLMHLVKGINDSGTPTANWKANNTAVWPDEQQMAVARKQDLDRPLLVYNLNKNRTVALYQDAPPDSRPCSGEAAYERYSKIAGSQLLRRGAYPVYGGKPIGILIGSADSMLADTWSKFILVYYPQRRNLLAMIEGDEFKSGQRHRDAGLERVAIFMGNDKTDNAT